MLMRCTRKVLQDLRIKDADLVEEAPGPGGDWFVNWIRIDRKKCVMFMHATTLYSFIVGGVMRKDFDRFDAFFIEHLREILTASRYDPEAVDRMIGSLGSISYGKTNSRSVLGYMRDFDAMARVTIEMDGGLASSDLIAVSLDLNESPLIDREFYNAHRGMGAFVKRFLD